MRVCFWMQRVEWAGEVGKQPKRTRRQVKNRSAPRGEKNKPSPPTPDQAILIVSARACVRDTVRRNPRFERALAPKLLGYGNYGTCADKFLHGK